MTIKKMRVFLCADGVENPREKEYMLSLAAKMKVRTPSSHVRNVFVKVRKPVCSGPFSSLETIPTVENYYAMQVLNSDLVESWNESDSNVEIICVGNSTVDDGIKLRLFGLNREASFHCIFSEIDRDVREAIALAYYTPRFFFITSLAKETIVERYPNKSSYLNIAFLDKMPDLCGASAIINLSFRKNRGQAGIENDMETFLEVAGSNSRHSFDKAGRRLQVKGPRHHTRFAYS